MMQGAFDGLAEVPDPPAASPTLTACVGHNADLFPSVMRLYVRPGARVLDMTWGKGNFWRDFAHEYALVRLDAVTDGDVRGDFRALPVRADSFDAAVLDPPYAVHGSPMKPSISAPYQLNNDISPRSSAEVRRLYDAGCAEARRVLVRGGVCLIKCQDQIESGRQRWIHAELLELAGFRAEDLFVLVQRSVPAMRVPYQLHARKNHSYFIVQRKI